ncbi:hypothetical protein BH10BAC4_BH10BAC4_21250 [soil metagenome]
MRLGQLARKLALRPAQIVDFLSSRSIQIDQGGNTRLEDDHVALILQKFAPNGFVEDFKDVIEEEPRTEAITPEPFVEEPAAISEISINEITLEEKIEVIKAPKIELSGLKVLGKIELPEIKKKEPVITDEQPSEETVVPVSREPRRENKLSYQRRERPQQTRPAKNPIAAQRELDAKEEQEKRKAALERDKEKRTLHYLKKVNVVQPTKSAKVEEEHIEEETIVAAQAPKTLWGKFKRWLRS